MNQKSIVSVLIILIVVLVGALGYVTLVKKTSLDGQSKTPVGNTVSETGSITSFAIVPSVKKQGWVMYRDGGKAVLMGKDIKSVEVRYYPTGTGVTESSRLGDMNKVSQSVNGDTWELKLPTFILATNFWAEATDLKGQKIKSTDLGSVGYEE